MRPAASPFSIAWGPMEASAIRDAIELLDV